MRGNLESKFAAHGTEPLELWGGQEGSEKHTKKKTDRKMDRQTNKLIVKQMISLRTYE